MGVFDFFFIQAFAALVVGCGCLFSRMFSLFAIGSGGFRCNLIRDPEGPMASNWSSCLWLGSVIRYVGSSVRPSVLLGSKIFRFRGNIFIRVVSPLYCANICKFTAPMPL